MRNHQGPIGLDETQNGPHVVVVGGGFGGLTLVRELASARRRGRLEARITLIDRHNHQTFQPLLYQIATAGLQPQMSGSRCVRSFAVVGSRQLAPVAM